MDDDKLIKELKENVKSHKTTLLRQMTKTFGVPKLSRSSRPLDKFQLKNFHVIGEFINPVLSDNYIIGSSDNYVNFITIDTKSKTHLHGGIRGGISKTYHFRDSFSVCAFNTTINLGRTYIRKEKFSDKFSEFFNPIEIDLDEYPKFSSTYFCLTNTPDTFTENINKNIIHLFENYDNDITVEFHKNICVVKSKYSVRQKLKTLRTVEFALKLQKLTNKNGL